VEKRGDARVRRERPGQEAARALGTRGSAASVSTSQTASPADTAQFTFSIPLPSDLDVYTEAGATIVVGVAIKDANGRVSNNVLLNLSFSRTKAGSTQLKIETKTFCDPESKPYCFVSTSVSCSEDGSVWPNGTIEYEVNGPDCNHFDVSAGDGVLCGGCAPTAAVLRPDLYRTYRVAYRKVRPVTPER
jgi:hypothetical protein